MYELSNWSFRRSGDNRYLPDDAVNLVVSGFVTGHPHFDDGTLITTSNIVAAHGRRMTTQNGTAYVLTGDPDPEYVEYLDIVGKTMNPDNPVSFLG